METVINIDGRELPDYLDGDWEINYCFVDYLVSVSVIARNPEEALRYASYKLPVLSDEPLEINARLVGVYGGM
jgi:hypothetical protein